jgi:hypothetical protein
MKYCRVSHKGELATLTAHRRDWLHEHRRHVLDVLVYIQQFLDDGLAIVVVERLLTLVSFKEMKDSWVIRVPCEAVVDDSWFGLRKSRRFSIDCLKSICLFGVCINLCDDEPSIYTIGEREIVRSSATTYRAIDTELPFGNHPLLPLEFLFSHRRVSSWR